MIIQRAYKTELNVTNKQRVYFVQCAGVARYVYNWALADRIAKHEVGEKAGRFEQSRRWSAIKDELAPWVRQYPYAIQDRALENLDLAYQNFFRRIKKGTEKSGFPKFKSRKNGIGSFSLRGSIHVEPRRIKLPVIGWVNIFRSNYLPVEGVKINKATISERAGHWFVSLQVEEMIETPIPATNDVIGIDVGIKSLAVLSNGKIFENPKTLYKYQGRLAKLQRELSRRTKGSCNREKTRRKLAKAHYKVECVRKNNLHNITSYIIKKKKPSVIVIENLNIVGMMQNRHLSKALADASLSEIKRQIIYKAKWHGVKVVEADRWYPSSKTCSNCGNRKPMLSLGERVYKCEVCGHVEDRDLNAAKNLKNLANKEPANGGGLPVELACSNALL